MFEVTNQPPPLEPYNLLGSDTVLREAVAREDAGWAGDDLSALGATLGSPETVQAGLRRQQKSAGAAHTRPLRPSPRRSRVSSRLAHATWPRSESRAAFEPLGRAEAGRPCGARRRHLHAHPDRKRRLLPARHDLRLGTDAAARAGDRQAVAAEDFRPRLRPPFRSGQGETARAARHGHDREPGRLRSAHQYHARRARG